MPFNGSSATDDGSSSKQIAGEQEALKNANLALIHDCKSHEEDDLDLEKGIKVANDTELAESEIGQETGGHELKDSDEEEEGRCRVCHLVFGGGELCTSESMQLGCHCKEDLAIAHRDCAEAWFKIKGNRICEICGATALNIVGREDTGFMEQWNDADATNTAELPTRCWQSLSLCNFFLACMVVTFILLWLFRVAIA